MWSSIFVAIGVSALSLNLHTGRICCDHIEIIQKILLRSSAWRYLTEDDLLKLVDTAVDHDVMK